MSNFKGEKTNLVYMPTVKFTKALKRFFPELADTTIEGTNLKEALTEVDRSYPGLKRYLLDDNGSLRKHVNIFIDGNLLSNRDTLNESFTEHSEIYIIQALSGG